MQITINTAEPLSAVDRTILAGLTAAQDEPAKPAPVKAAPSKPAPVKAAAPAKPAPVVEETPEPEIEETSLRDQAIARVTELLGKGEGKRVKAALSGLGVAKVSLLSDEDLPAFITELA